MADKAAYESAFVYAGNDPVNLTDNAGLYKISVAYEKEYRERYPLIMKYLDNQVALDMGKRKGGKITPDCSSKINL